MSDEAIFETVLHGMEVVFIVAILATIYYLKKKERKE